MRRILPLIAILLLCAGAMCCALSLGSVAPPHFKSAHAQLLTTGAGGVPGGSAGDTWCNLVNAVIALTHCVPFDNANTTFNSSGSGTAVDVKGGNNAALTNVGGVGSGPSTNLNNAGNFIGANNSIGAFSISNLLPTTGGFTLIMLLQPPNSNGNRILANDHTDADSKGFQVWESSNFSIQLTFGNGVTACAAQSGTYSASTWGMSTWVYDGASTLTPYFNTTAGGGVSCVVPTISTGTKNAAFGYNPAYSGDYYTGYIGGVAISASQATSGNVSTINGY